MPQRHSEAPSEGDLYAAVEWVAGGEYEDIRYETAGGIAKIAIDRPEVLNAFRPQTLVEISAALELAREDTGVGVVILTGAGEKAFCSGGDQRVRGDVAAVAADALVAARAEGLLAGPGEDHDADPGVLAGELQRGGDLDQGLRPEGVQHLGPVDRDLGDPAGRLVADVLVLSPGDPLDRGVEVALGRGFAVSLGHDGHDIPGRGRSARRDETRRLAGPEITELSRPRRAARRRGRGHLRGARGRGDLGRAAARGARGAPPLGRGADDGAAARAGRARARADEGRRDPPAAEPAPDRRRARRPSSA